MFASSAGVHPPPGDALSIWLSVFASFPSRDPRHRHDRDGPFPGARGTKARTVAILLRWPAAPSVSTPKEMDRVIGAAFWVLA
jgi:hypothetical protein